ncbi:LOW QUALITY PROTEIN: Pol protein [Phytophthora palmivora]|uniref:Pol protein n=1 Tax=Phytophthora palmivora TaxID=4796 RepID=A0A2P4XIH9_9STRA|nr:LOW QUALITY PROTEIN: Pol protein [Phytophthora palmivora]
MRRQTQCKEPQQLELAQGRYPWNWVRPYRVPSAVTDVGSSGTCNVPDLAGGQRKFPSKLRGSRGPWQKPRPKGQGNWGHQSADGARHGGLAPESLGALETRESGGRLLVVHTYVRGYGDPFRIPINSGASTNFARRQTVARNGDKIADALRESKGRGQVSVRLADGTVVNVPGVRMDLAVKFEDFDSTESFLVLDMDKYDVILGMPWLEKHEPWIDWRGKAIGASRLAVSDRALVSNVPTSVRDWGTRDGLEDAYASGEVTGVTDFNENIAMSIAIGHKIKVYCRVCEIAMTASPNDSGRRAVWVATVAAPNGTDKAGNIESAESDFGVDNVVPREVEESNTRKEAPLSTSRVGNQVPRSESETPPARPVEDQYPIFDGVSGRQVRAGAVRLEALPEITAKPRATVHEGLQAGLEAEGIEEMALDSSSAMNEDAMKAFAKQSATSFRSEILKTRKNLVYPLVKEFSDVVSKHPPSQLPPNRGVRTRLISCLAQKPCEVIDVFFANKAKSCMVRESKSPHSTPTFFVRKPNGKWCLVHAYNKLNNTTVPVQTPISHKDLLLNNILRCTLYSSLDLVDGYYQTLMRESDIPLTAVSTPSGKL